MDVKCQKCGIEYEFDDDRITPDGVTVKCTSCGHIFKVKREVRVVTEEVAEGIDTDWMVRQGSGNVFTFKELTTLQRWIVERKVGRDDEISRTGKTWKRLGDIAELASFFQVVDDANIGAQAQQQPILLNNPMMTPAAMPSAAPMSTANGMAVAPTTASSTAIPSTLPAPAAAPTPVATQPPQPVESGEWVDADNIDDDYLDDEDPVRSWRRRRRLPMFLLGFVVLVALGIGGLALFARPVFDDLVAQAQGLFKAELPPEAQRQIGQAEEATRRDVVAELLQAEAACKEAISLAPSAAEPYAALALVQLSLAEAIREQLRLTKLQYDLLRAKHPDGFADDSPEKKQALALKNRAEQGSEEAGRRFKQAVNGVEEALRIDKNNGFTNLVAAEYYRSKGLLDKRDQHLSKAAKHYAAEDPRMQLVRAMPAGNKVANADELGKLEQLVHADPLLGRAQFQLIRGKEEGNDLQGASAAAKELLEKIPNHERAKAWLAFQDRKREAEKPPPEPPKEVKEVKETPAEPKEKEADNFDTLVTKGDRLRDRGSSTKALKFYSKAAALEPKRAEPRSGQGWCYLDMDNTAAALGSFQSALEANPNYSEAHMGMAETHRARGNKAKALKHYQRYLEISPSGAEANVAHRYIKELATPTP